MTLNDFNSFFFFLPFRSASDRSGKDCCGQWFNGPPLRFLVVLVALGGVACKFTVTRRSRNFFAQLFLRLVRYTRRSNLGINSISWLTDISSHSWTADDGYDTFLYSRSSKLLTWKNLAKLSCCSTMKNFSFLFSMTVNFCLSEKARRTGLTSTLVSTPYFDGK